VMHRGIAGTSVRKEVVTAHDGRVSVHRDDLRVVPPPLQLGAILPDHHRDLAGGKLLLPELREGFDEFLNLAFERDEAEQEPHQQRLIPLRVRLKTLPDGIPESAVGASSDTMSIVCSAFASSDAIMPANSATASAAALLTPFSV